MAVDASHVTLLDLGSNACPPLTSHHASDVVQLVSRISVVELEHDDVVDATIDAGMRREVCHNLASILYAPTVYLRDSPPDVISFVR
jgi:hypothetical protein